jgi:dGTPase
MKYYSNWFQAKSMDAGRIVPERSQKYRNNFQKDRDRILYSKAFRRLSGKTQVFLAGQNDHLRTRLTHSIEVNQLARTIGSNLDLNLDLIEAIALGHDIGHTPFGHIGERTLNFIMNGCEPVKEFNLKLPKKLKGFKHNLQALRIVNTLESSKENFDGLNLTNLTQWGIANHTKICAEECNRTMIGKKRIKCYFEHFENKCKQKGILLLDYYDDYLAEIDNARSWSIEGIVVAIADEIAQRHHDIEDGIVTGLIEKDDIVELIKKLFTSYLDKRMSKVLSELERLKQIDLLPAYVSRILVNLLVTQAIIDIRSSLIELGKKYSIKSPNDFSKIKEQIYKNEKIFKLITYNQHFKAKDVELHSFLKNKILSSYIAQKMDGKAEYIIRNLFNAYVSNPQQLPDRSILFFIESYLGKEYIYKAVDRYSDKNLIGGLRKELKNNFERNPSPDYKHEL